MYDYVCIMDSWLQKLEACGTKTFNRLCLSCFICVSLSVLRSLIKPSKSANICRLVSFARVVAVISIQLWVN